MHNEYVRLCCILNKKDKLALLKYKYVDITKASDLLYRVTLDLIHQCQNHVGSFYSDITKENKKYARTKPEKIGELKLQVNEQLLDMAFVEMKYIEYYMKPGNKTKEDLLTYVFASQITDKYFNRYLFNVLLNYLNAEMGNDFWNKHSLYNFEIDKEPFPNFVISRDKREELNVGNIKHDLNKPVASIRNYMLNRTNGYNEEDTLNYKLDMIREMGLILNNYNDMDYPIFNYPYKDTIIDLVDNIMVSIDLDKPKKLIKRM